MALTTGKIYRDKTGDGSPAILIKLRPNDQATVAVFDLDLGVRVVDAPVVASVGDLPDGPTWAWVAD